MQLEMSQLQREERTAQVTCWRNRKYHLKFKEKEASMALFSCKAARVIGDDKRRARKTLILLQMIHCGL